MRACVLSVSCSTGCRRAPSAASRRRSRRARARPVSRDSPALCSGACRWRPTGRPGPGPRHAAVLLVRGPVTWNMREALLGTYNATRSPKWVVALGACAANCGVFAGSSAVVGPLAEILPVDLHVRGCPPAPLDIVAGLLALIEARG